MNLNEAIELVEKHNGLIGQYLDKKKITHIYIIPNNASYNEIVKRVLYEENYMDLLVKHDDFSVVVLFDGNDTSNSILLFQDIFKTLEELERINK